MKNLLLFVSVLFFIGCSQSNMVSIVEDSKGQNIITLEGNHILKESYDKVSLYNDQFIKIETAKKVGMSDYKGNVLLEPIYDFISPLYNGFATISKEGKIGIVNDEMKIVLIPSYDEIKIGEYHFIVKKENKYRCMDESFSFVGNSYDYIYYYVDGFARVENSEKFGFINNKCQEVAQVQYDYVSDFINGFAKVKINDKFSFLDKDMNIITKEEYKNANFFEGK